MKQNKKDFNNAKDKAADGADLSRAKKKGAAVKTESVSGLNAAKPAEKAKANKKQNGKADKTLKVRFLGGVARFITKPCLKQRVMRFPTIRYGCSAQ